MTKEFVLVRHSERIDEVDKLQWASLVDNDKSGRSFMSVANDPPITANGTEIAKQAATTLCGLSLITKAQQNRKTLRIYSSRLIRCVQTAYEIALVLKLPIYIASGLSLTAIAVIKAKGSFEFLSMNELRNACPGVELIDCDDPTNTDLFVPNDSWQRAVETITIREETGVLVVHRETIRNFCSYRLRTPYCCLGLLTFNEATGTGTSDPVFYLSSIQDHNGDVVETPSKEQNVIRKLIGSVKKTEGEDSDEEEGDIAVEAVSEW